MRSLLVVCLALLGACVSSDVVQCAGGSACPAGTKCASVEEVTYCVHPEQIAACEGVLDGDACTTPSITSGGCHGGSCFTAVCGNALVDPGEACDKGDQRSGDGCSGDCKSTEVCGNGQPDAIKREQCDDGNLTSHDGCDSGCRNETPVWTGLAAAAFFSPATGPLEYAAMAYDEARSVVVVFGGQPPGGLPIGDTWLFNGFGWSKAQPLVSPSPRVGAAMAYDAKRQRVVLFGGETGLSVGTSFVRVDDTWEWDGSNWSLRPTGDQPSPRRDAGMVYDAAAGRVVLYGGKVSGQEPADDATWIWDGTRWDVHTPSARPETRDRPAMAYDPKRGRVVMYGGRGSATQGGPALYLTTTWEFDGTEWVNRNAAPPMLATPMVANMALAWDAMSERVIMLGGDTGTTTYNKSTFAWDGTSWTRLADAPVGRSLVAMASDTTRKRIVAWGGTSSGVLAEVDEWNGSAWNKVAQPLHGGITTQIATDVHRGRAVMFDDSGDTWEFDGHAWTLEQPTAEPPQRSSPALTYDPARREVILFGGGDDTAQLRDTWRYDGISWQLAATTGPPPRHHASLAYDAKRQRVVLFGGRGASGALDDTWLWDGTSWQQATGSPVTPEARYGAGIAYDALHEQVVLVSGYNEPSLGTRQFFGDTYLWNGTAWSLPSFAVRPTARRAPAMAWDPTRRRIVLYGGEGADARLQDTWEWDGQGWSLVPVNEVPINRADAAMFADPDGAGVVMFGGTLRDGQITTETFRLRWQGPTGDEVCRDGAADLDADGRTSCADVDCWARCTPQCPPGTTCTMPGCGDGTCDIMLESCRLCPQDCGVCAPVCGDFHCEPAEACPGDC